MDSNMTINDLFRSIVKQENEKLLNSIKELLAGITGSTDDSKPLNFEEACTYLLCSSSYLYELTSAREIPHSKCGKRLFFIKSDLDAWMLKSKVRTVDQIKEDALSRILKERRK